MFWDILIDMIWPEEAEKQKKQNKQTKNKTYIEGLETFKKDYYYGGICNWEFHYFLSALIFTYISTVGDPR